MRANAFMMFLAFSLLVPAASWPPTGVIAQDATPRAGCVETSEDQNKALIDRYVNSVWDRTDLDALAEFLSDDYVRHGQTEEFSWEEWATAFPDLSGSLSEFAAAEDLVAGRWSATATHTGEFQGVAPSGNPVEWVGFSIYRIECGKIAEIWNQQDYIGLFRQMGVEALPEHGATPASSVAQDATPPSSTPENCRQTTAEENTELVRQFAREVWDGANLEGLETFLADDATANWATSDLSFQEWRSGFPDLATTLTEYIADENLVYGRWIATGTHDGEFQGIAPSGTSVELHGISQYRIECGKIATVKVHADLLGLYQQLGNPPIGSTPSAG